MPPGWSKALASLAVVDGFNSGGSQTCYSNSSSSLGYGYDDWARLMTFDCGSGGWGQNYTYDMYDNLTKTVISGRTGTTWSPGYSSTTNHYSIGSYDSNGNVTSDGNNAYMWNEYSKLKSTANGGGSVTCGTTGNCAIYDAFGRMVEMSNGSAWTELWQLQTGTTVNMSGSTTNYYYLPVGGGGTLEITGTGVAYYLHKDWLGNARIISYVNGHDVGQDRAYSPYGEIYNNYFNSGPRTAQFAGISDDFNPGVEWSTPNRELSIVGRWLSPDPAGQGGQWNRYAYPTNPNSMSDPSGLCGVGGDDNVPCGNPDPNPPGAGSYCTGYGGCDLPGYYPGGEYGGAGSGCEGGCVAGAPNVYFDPFASGPNKGYVDDPEPNSGTSSALSFLLNSSLPCSGPGIPCMIVSLSWLSGPIRHSGQTTYNGVPTAGIGDVYVYTVVDSNYIPVWNASSVTELYQDASSPDSGWLVNSTWSAGSSLLLGTFGDTLGFPYDATSPSFNYNQTFIVQSGGVTYSLATEFQQVAIWGGGNSSFTAVFLIHP